MNDKEKKEKRPKMVTRTASVVVAPEGSTIFSERAIRISIDDMGGGEFIAIEGEDGAKVLVDPEEWPELKKAIETMVGFCRE